MHGMSPLIRVGLVLGIVPKLKIVETFIVETVSFSQGKEQVKEEVIGQRVLDENIDRRI